MLDRDYCEVVAERVSDGITIRWVVGRPEGAPNFAMRVIEFEPEAAFARHEHPYEHEIFVLEGEGICESPVGNASMRRGTVIYIPPGEPHSYRNVGSGPLRFICVIPHPEEG